MVAVEILRRSQRNNKYNLEVGCSTAFIVGQKSDINQLDSLYKRYLRPSLQETASMSNAKCNK
eukprot:1802704-Amphidinium_carterae.1